MYVNKEAKYLQTLITRFFHKLILICNRISRERQIDMMVLSIQGYKNFTFPNENLGKVGFVLRK